ncbi:hypothetical protein EBZ39_05640 [bacterium]|nr:hypothetical protein [bacterium]
MKRVKIFQKDQVREFIAEDPTDHLNHCVALNVWGKPERWQLEKNGDSGPLVPDYDQADVIDSEDRPDPVSGELVRWVKLRAEYSIEIEDISYEYNLSECLKNRRAEYPSPEDFMNAFFDGGSDDLEKLQALRLEIKQRYPKPSKPE